MDRYRDYEHLSFDRPSDGVLLITMNRPEVGNAMNERLHQEVGQIWKDVEDDVEARVLVITGAGDRFSMGGEPRTVDEANTDFQRAVDIMREISGVVYGMTNCEKVIISAINGPAVAGGASVALLADIAVMAENAWISDGHCRAGMAAGDHAVLVWPSRTSLTKAKYYLMTGDKIDGREAERIGLVTFAVPVEEVVPRALDIAGRLATGSQTAIRWTKRSLNHTLRQASPAWEHSLALQLLSHFSDDVAAWGAARRAGLARPTFPSTQS